MAVIEAFEVAVKVGKKVYYVEVKTTLGVEAATRRAHVCMWSLYRDKDPEKIEVIGWRLLKETPTDFLWPNEG